ncbi:M14 family metallopeptidase [Caballeronia sp. LZ032]|uniref:M14 family metallopeptidase n=1 Tax=Caballeronia sp. LZ032 TaxID=3038565 RepID=UPI00285F1AE5|nr:M14 family metallopeptidase [Caballeronia sp. LZ032]MDR5881200.1 M14 family metallopeptidase [Caballeronia sp. LZ032]
MFSSTYREARQRFLDTAAERGLAVDTRVLAGVAGLEGELLATDVVRIGPRSARRMLVLTSATHGVEGFCGSGAQIALMRDDGLAALMKQLDVALLLVHAINPYGFSFLSRTTEGNVDLNRNSIDFAAPLPQNPGYAELHELLIPASWPPDEANVQAIRGYIEERGEWAYQQAVTTGQYTHPQGLFYGGAETAWSTRTMRELLTEYGEGCASIGWIDFHTGLGPSGFGAKICVGDVPRARRWWGADVTSPADGTSIAADIAGPLLDTLRQTCPRSANASIAVEYGTVPLTEMLDMLRADQWVRQHADAPDAVKHAIRQQIRAAFYIDDDVWRGKILGQARAAVLQGLYGLSREA